jgi:hypothetical protein
MDDEGWSAPDPQQTPSQGPVSGGQPSGPPGQPGYGVPGYPPPGYAPQAPKPGVVPLRPLGVGEILDGAITAVRTNPKAMIGLSFIVIAVTQLLALPLKIGAFRSLDTLDQSYTVSSGGTASTFGSDASASPGALAGLGAIALGGILAQIVLTGMLVHVVGRAVLGRRTTMGETWAATKPMIWRLIGLALLIAVIYSGVLVAAVVVGGIAIALFSNGFGVLLLVLALLAGGGVCVFLWPQLTPAAAALVLERASVGTAIKRSSSLVRTGWWRVFGILLLGTFLVGVIGYIISIPFSAALFAQGSVATGAAPTGYLVASTIGTIIAQTVTLPFQAAFIALTYIDLRMRREGLDLELIRTASAGPGQPPAQPQGSW